MAEQKETHGISRRAVIASATFIPVAALTAGAQTKAAPAVPTALSPTQLKTVEAFVERLIPKDELGPSAAEAGAQTYIDRVLAGPNAGEKASFVDGLAALDTYAKESQGAAFADIPAEKRDQVLTAMDNNTAQGFPNARAFFNRVRRLTLEGMFGDPYYGGNQNFAGWDLIQYPGPRLAVGPVEQKLNTPIKPYRSSAYGPAYGRKNGR